MRILLLNQYGPGDASPTARLLGDLAGALEAAGHAVRTVHAGGDYRHRADAGGRMRRELGAHGAILRAGLAGPRPEVVISFSSPPLLVVTGALVARRHRAAHVHWALDVYPDLAVALGEIGDGAAARRLAALHGWALRDAHRVVTLDRDMRDHLVVRYRVESVVLPPWPPLHGTLADAAPEPGPVWLYSGNLGRAHEWRPLLAIQRRLEAAGTPAELRIQGGGWAWPQAREAAADLRHVDWRPYASDDDLLAGLLAARVLVVTQRPEARGLLWPSKLAVAARLPRPLLFIGPEDGAIARALRQRGQAGVFAPDRDEDAAAWLQSQLAAFPPPGPAVSWDEPRREGLAAWCALVADVGAPVHRPG